MTNRADDLVPVAKVRSGLEAARIIALLAARGVQGASAGVDNAPMGTFGAVQVLVRRIDLERAELALAQARGDREADFDFGAASGDEPAEGEPPPSPVRRPGWRRNSTTLGVVILAACAATVIWCWLTIKYLPSTLSVVVGAAAAVGAMLVVTGLGAGSSSGGGRGAEDDDEDGG